MIRCRNGTQRTRCTRSRWTVHPNWLPKVGSTSGKRAERSRTRGKYAGAFCPRDLGSSSMAAVPRSAWIAQQFDFGMAARPSDQPPRASVSSDPITTIRLLTHFQLCQAVESLENSSKVWILFEKSGKMRPEGARTAESPRVGGQASAVMILQRD